MLLYSDVVAWNLTFKTIHLRYALRNIYNGFYRTGTGKEQQFVRLERDQFVGACNAH